MIHSLHLHELRTPPAGREQLRWIGAVYISGMANPIAPPMTYWMS